MAPSMRLLVLLAAPALAMADDPRVTRLEQDVRSLQRDVMVLSRQLDQVRLQTTRPTLDGSVPPPPVLALSNPGWVDAAKWKRLRPGMSELEVIGSLGPPTSTREKDGSRELFYAMEIGDSAYLAGSVVMRDHVVAEVRSPVLR
jgi:hypothetical protein